MASLRDIRKRIKSVKNTQKITKAMKMVSAAKLRRAQLAVEATRPYSDKLHETVSGLALRAEAAGEALPALITSESKARTVKDNAPALLGQHEKQGRVEIVVLTSDRGLCGGFNSNTVRRAQRFVFDERNTYENITISTIGKKGYELLKNKVEVRTHHQGVLDNPTFENASEIAHELCADYVQNELDGLFIAYNEFKGGLVLKQMLPVVPLDVADDLPDYRYEPSKTDLLQELLPQYFATQIYRALLETIAAEHLARMMAMEAATSNASEMVDKLTLDYNRARQAAITNELMEIISGAEALK